MSNSNLGICAVSNTILYLDMVKCALCYIGGRKNVGYSLIKKIEDFHNYEKTKNIWTVCLYNQVQLDVNADGSWYRNLLANLMLAQYMNC